MQDNPQNILIIAGEPSGDMRGGELLKELNKSLPGISFWGIGGDHMLREGVELIEHIRKLSVVGVWEGLKSLPRTKLQLRRCVRAVQKRKPIAAILIDYPGFNLTLAKYFHDKNIPVIYYVIPQVWAWGTDRTELLKRRVDKILVLFEFEKRFLKDYGIEAEFVGHPLVDKASNRDRPYFPKQTKQKIGSVPISPITVALLPGSRETEIKNLLPVTLKAASILRKEQSGINFVLAESSNVKGSVYDSILSKYNGLDIQRIKDNTFEALERSDFAIVAAGTATLETAMMGKPLVVIYKAAVLTYFFFRFHIKIPYLGLVNIIAGKEVAPEFLQFNAVPEKISKKVLEIINDNELLVLIKDELKKVKTILGEKGASRRAAEAITRFLKTNSELRQ